MAGFICSLCSISWRLDSAVFSDDAFHIIICVCLFIVRFCFKSSSGGI